MLEALQNPVFRRFAALASGSVAGQAMMFIAMPIATQLYTPADFGLLGAFSSVVMLALPATCLRFDLAIPIPADDNEARALSVLGLVSASAISMLAWLLLGPLGSALGKDFVLLFELYGWLVPLTLWTAALFSLAQYWAVRSQCFGKLAVSHVSRGLMGAATQVGLGITGVGGLGLLLGQAIYMGLGAVYLAASFLRAELCSMRHLSAAFVYNTGKRYWRFPVFSTPESVLDSAGMHLPLLLVASLSGAETAGLLFFAQRLTLIPIGLIGSNLSRVYLGEAPKQLANGNLHTFTMKLWRTLFFIGLGPVLLGAVSAPLLTETLFGAEWSSASGIIVVLLPSAFLQFCVAPLSTALHVLGKQAVAMALQAFGLFAQVGSILAAYAVGLENPIVGLALGATVYYAVFTITIIWTTRAK